jgi:uncharacterized peroxidase-related enzyme
MSRIEAIDVAAATGNAKDLLEGVKKGLGVVPNLFRVTAQSPHALEGMVALHGAIGKGLNAKLREAIALATAEADGCDYCFSVHTYLGKRAGLSDSDLTDVRDGRASDPKTAAASRFARLLVERRGHVGASDLTDARRAGFSDGEIIDIIANVAWSVFTNYVNVVAETEIDFDPIVRHREK